MVRWDSRLTRGRRALVKWMKYLAAVDRQGFLVEIQWVIDAGLDGAVNRVGTAVRPIIPLSGFHELYTGNVLDIFISVLIRRDQPQGKTVIFR